ncbi:restriction endonuclease subunit S [Actinomadura sp. NPDC000929]|uniref:restriction endonuclease subunit S n=1 Tax=Actinomadura sp. NPDC000929 TaxID=3154517 RepID=UPI003393B9AD
MTSIVGIGSIPESWPVQRAKWLMNRERRSINSSDRVVTAFRDGTVTLRANRRLSGFTEALQEIGYQGIRKGDLVVHSMDGFAGAIGISDSNGKASPVVHAYTPTSQADLRYYAYLIRQMALNGHITSLAKGIRERSTAFDSAMLANLVLPVPPLTEQRRIADFLDAETRRIDKLLQARWRQKSLLVEHTNQRISELATGVAKYKNIYNTGSPWIPNLPEGWKLLPLKRRWTVIDCKHRTPTYLDHGIPVISPGDIKPGRLDLSRAHRFVSESDYRDLADDLRRPRKGDIVYSRNASVGIAAYVDTAARFTMGQDVCRITSVDQDQLFLSFVLNVVVQGEIESLQIGSTFTRINIATLLGLGIPCPPPSEQRNIALQMDEVSHRGDDLQRKLDRQLEVLAERRQALITAAVTGQFDVSTASGRGVTE